MAKNYIDRLTGEKVSIVNEESNFYTLNDGVKIKKETFSKKFEESSEIDPAEFLNQNTSALDILAQNLKKVDTSKISDVSKEQRRIKYKPPVVLSDTSREGAPVDRSSDGQIKISEEKRQQMIDEYNMKKELGEVDISPPKFDENDDASYIEYEMPEIGGGSLRQINKQPQHTQNTHTQNTQSQQRQIDPLEMMFKMFKNNYDVKIELDINEKIAEPAFIEMIMSNVEGDAIEYYTKIILNKLLKNPLKLKKEIYTQLELEVYGEEYVQNKELEKQEKKRLEEESKKLEKEQNDIIEESDKENN